MDGKILDSEGQYVADIRANQFTTCPARSCTTSAQTVR